VAIATKQTGVVLQSWVSPALAEALKAQAELERPSVSATIRLAVEDRLRREGRTAMTSAHPRKAGHDLGDPISSPSTATTRFVVDVCQGYDDPFDLAGLEAQCKRAHGELTRAEQLQGRGLLVGPTPTARRLRGPAHDPGRTPGN
jgi:hypothetical protein